MKRACMPFLREWLNSADRQPLIIRGARQVGKTWLVRELAKEEKRELIELNFEDRRSLHALFATNEPAIILRSLESAIGQKIDPQHSILFLDEIQAAPDLIAKLRWFYEKMPELAVIAAGSLLEFALENYSLSMPVGRIEYIYLEPMSFEEFLLALGKDQLVHLLQSFKWGEMIPMSLHEDLSRYFKEYVIIGGMPAVIKTWIEKKSLSEVSRTHNKIIATYQDDFPKYGSKLSSDIFEDVLVAIPKNLGKKFVYSKVNRHIQSEPIKKALHLLCRARVSHVVKATAANGIPLAAEVKHGYNKVILLDVGLCSSALDLSLDELYKIQELDLINKGGIAEQVVGQLLRITYPVYKNPALYYWLRTEPGLSAEVDYVLQHRGKVVPIEVKAGSTGRLTSLHQFIHLKKLSLGVRINSELPFISDVDIKDNKGNSIKYELRSLPFYLIGQLPRLLD